MDKLEYLVIIAWNVFIGNKPATIRAALRRFIKDHKPDVILLMEASNLYGELDPLGYTVVQLKPRALRNGNVSNTANCAILVHPDYVVSNKKSLRMTEFWKGPKHGLPQDPRVYRSVNIRKKDDKTARTWRIAVAHTPFGLEARAESRRRLVAWLKSGQEGRPTVINLDANMGLREFDVSIATPGGAEASGLRIDLEAHKNCTLVSDEDLGNGPSDHPAILRKYATRRNA